MAVIKCKMCGGDLILEEGSNVAECEYCGSRQTVPSADNEKKLNLFARANRLRANNEFDKASGVYESIVADFPEEAEAYWGLILCKYGIEYVDDPATGKKIPTCHRSSFDSVMDDPNFELVMEYADPIARRVYREEAKQLEELRKGIIEVSSKEEPYDIFICYKETDEKGDRTLDSVLAQDVYDMLTENGYRVFFSRVTLEDKLGVEYEPYIFAALNSAKIMLAFGTDYDYYNAVWVKNEWSRFLQLIAKGEKKTLIPCYKNIDAYDMPKEFAKLQAQDLGKVGANQDLLRGIKKILPKEQPKAEAPQPVVQQVIQTGPNVAALLKRGNMSLEDKDWEKAKEYFDQVLNMDAENHDAYLGLTMVEAKIVNRDAFQTAYIDSNITESGNLRRARKFAIREQVAWWEKLDSERDSADVNKAEKKRREEEKKRQAKDADRERLQSIRQRIGQAQVLLSAGTHHTVGLNVDGTVVATKYIASGWINYSGRCEVSNWNNIVGLSAGFRHTVGLKSDGTVIATEYTGEEDEYHGQCEVSDWRNIVAVSAGSGHTVGLKADGTVIATKYTGKEVNYHGQCEVSDWRDIVAISAGDNHTVGLKTDGTVIASGANDCGQCEVSDWRGIVAISAGSDHSVGLKADGTVIATKYIGFSEFNEGQCEVSEWKDIVAIAAGSGHTVGLRADGTVIATKFRNTKYSSGRCDVSGWSNIIAISAGNFHTVGLKADGTVVATKYTGDTDNGQCNVDGWRLFKNYETLAQERNDAVARAEQRRREQNERNRLELSGKIAAAQQRQSTAKSEIANLKGLFTGKRRKELEAEIASLDRQIAELQKQFDAIQD